MNKCSEGLGCIHFYVRSLCNIFIKIYTETFYMIHKGDVPCFQCSLCWWEKQLAWVLSTLMLMFHCSHHNSIDSLLMCIKQFPNNETADDGQVVMLLLTISQSVCPVWPWDPNYDSWPYFSL